MHQSEVAFAERVEVLTDAPVFLDGTRVYVFVWVRGKKYVMQAENVTWLETVPGGESPCSFSLLGKSGEAFTRALTNGFDAVTRTARWCSQ